MNDTKQPQPSAAPSQPQAEQPQLRDVSYNSEGLVPAIVQAADTNDVLMLAWMDEEALRRTLSTGRMWYWSRSRQQYWCKGETSGDRQYLAEASYDCDGDTLLFKVHQQGKGACHTGEWSCFFRSFEFQANQDDTANPRTVP